MSQLASKNQTRQSQNGRITSLPPLGQGGQARQQKHGISRSRRFWGRFWAAFIRIGVLVPIIMAAITGIIYVAYQAFKPHQNFVQISHWWVIAAPIIAWVVLAAVCNTVATAEKINPLSYDALKNELAHYKTYCDTVGIKDGPGREAAQCYDTIQNYLRTTDSLSWALSTGYITAWKMTHHLKEAFMEFGPKEAVIREALGDKLCIKGSTIQSSEALLNTLAQAVKVLDPSSALYFDESNPSLLAGVNTLPTANDSASLSTNNQAGTAVPVATPEQARSMLREVRVILDRFISDRWEGLVHTRNLLLATIAITGIVIYLLLIIAIVTNVPGSLVTGGIIFYIVGTISGLFGWLYKASKVDTAKVDTTLSDHDLLNDHGLSFARLVATPLLSGLGGLGGVIITAVLYNILLPKLSDTSFKTIFTLTPSLLVTAALFGLAPSLIIGTLLKQSKQYVDDLDSVKPSNQGGTY